MPLRFKILVAIQLVASLYALVTSFTISTQLFMETGSAFVMALSVFFQTAPRIYLSFFAGLIIDRIDVFITLRYANWAEAALATMVSIALVYIDDVTYLFWTFVLVKSAIAAVKTIAMGASIKFLVEERHFQRASGIVAGLQNFALAAGPFLGLAAYHVIGPDNIWLIFLVDGLVFTIAGFAVSTLQDEKAQSALPRVNLESLTAGARFIGGQPQLRVLLGYFAMQNFFNGLCAGLIPFLILTLAAGDLSVFAASNAIMSLAAVAGAFAAATLPTGSHRIALIAMASIGAAIVGRIGLGVGDIVWLAIAALAFRAILLPVADVINQVIWLELTPKDSVGRVLGTRRAAAQGTYPVAILLGSFFVHVTADQSAVALLWLFAACGIGELCAVLFLVLRFRQINACAPSPENQS